MNAMTPIVSFELPFRAVNVRNAREHFGQRSRRNKEQRSVTCMRFKPLVARIVFPLSQVRIRLTRFAPSAGLDPHDGLPASLGPCVDGCADALGIDDRDRMVTWEYAQARRSSWGVLVEVFA
jgi:hypothetical protein